FSGKENECSSERGLQLFGSADFLVFLTSYQLWLRCAEICPYNYRQRGIMVRNGMLPLVGLRIFVLLLWRKFLRLLSTSLIAFLYVPLTRFQGVTQWQYPRRLSRSLCPCAASILILIAATVFPSENNLCLAQEIHVSGGIEVGFPGHTFPSPERLFTWTK